MHSHTCWNCTTVWHHPNSCAGSKQDHTCPSCGKECFEGRHDNDDKPHADYVYVKKGVYQKVKRLKNEGCVTRAPKAEIFVTSQGELSRHNKDIEIPGIDWKELAVKHNIDFGKVAGLTRDSKSRFAKHWYKLIEEEIYLQLSKTLTPRQLAFVRKVDTFQKQVDFGRFRVYGEIYRGQERIVVVTEFIAPENESDFWHSLACKAEELKAHTWIMREDEDKESPYQFGRQVELSWRIEKLTVKEFKSFLKVLKKQTQRLYNKRGVGVG